MNSLLMAKIDLLPADKQKEVETFVQYLVDRYAVSKPVEPTVMETRRKAFQTLSTSVFSSADFDEKPEDAKR